MKNKVDKESKEGIIKIKKKVKEYLVKYQKTKVQLECYETLKISNKDANNDRLFVIYVEKCLKLFNDDQQELIKNEFLTRYYDKRWYQKKYKREQFVKLRDETVREFYLFINECKFASDTSIV